MRKGLGSFFVLVTLVIPAGLAAQDRYSLPPTAGGDAWRVADPTPLAPAYYEQPAVSSALQPTVLVSEPASTPWPSSTTWPPVVLPPASAPVYAHPPQPIPPPVTAYRPLIPVAPPPPQYYLGRGIFGQPKLYVPEQPVRNFLRYLSF
jgi:hypothetical protein